MTANEAITKADTLRPNQIPKATKTEWICQLERTVYHEIYKTHDTTDIEFTDMDSETFTDDKLFVPAPYEVPSIVKVPLADLAFMVYFVLVFIKSIT